jgi:hypothetical protein
MQNGLDAAPLWIVINGKVLEFTGARDTPFFKYFIKHGFGGQDFTLRFARSYYEPMFDLSLVFFKGPRASAADLGHSHSRWVEDQFWAPPSGLSAVWKLVGLAQ